MTLTYALSQHARKYYEGKLDYMPSGVTPLRPDGLRYMGCAVLVLWQDNIAFTHSSSGLAEAWIAEGGCVVPVYEVQETVES